MIETAVYVNSIGPVDPINMVRLWFVPVPGPLLADVANGSDILQRHVCHFEIG